MVDPELQSRLAAVADGLGGGLSLAASAARQGVMRRALVCWVRLADEGLEPWMSWLVGVLKADAEARADYLDGLRRISGVDAGAVRDYRHSRGEPSPLERELTVLRKEARLRQSRLDARKMQREVLGDGS